MAFNVHLAAVGPAHKITVQNTLQLNGDPAERLNRMLLEWTCAFSQGTVISFDTLGPTAKSNKWLIFYNQRI